MTFNDLAAQMPDPIQVDNADLATGLCLTLDTTAAELREKQRQYEQLQSEILAAVAGELEALKAEWQPSLDAAQALFDRAVAAAKTFAVKNEVNLQSRYYRVSMVIPAPKWDNAMLEGYAISHPDVLRCRTDSVPYARVVERKGEK